MYMKKLLISCLLLIGMNAGAQTLPTYLDETKPVEQRIDDVLSRMTLDEKIAVIHAQSKFSAAGVPRLGIPDLWTDDGPHGIRPNTLWDKWRDAGQTNDSCVDFPALTCLAATWNPALAGDYGVSLGEEARYRSKDVVLGPGMNIYRSPIGGRNFEYLGEDPFLASRMVVPYIQGIQSTGTAACAKHFALNNEEAFRKRYNVVVSDRALHEIYLPAFKAAVEEGKVWAVMCAYNLYNNQPCCANDVLVNKILKGDWKFDGVAMTDWGVHTTTDDAVKYGLDMEFGTHTDGLAKGKDNAYEYYYLARPYKEGILSGKYSMKDLDEKVRRVLRLHFRTTMNRHRAYGFMCSEAHYDVARKIGEEGIVLLQNKRSLLPLNANAKRILVVGENAIKPMTVGGGSSSLKVQREVSPLDGLKARLGDKVQIDYARGYVGDTIVSYSGYRFNTDLRDNRSAEELKREAIEKAKGADYVIFVGGLNKCDGQDAEGYDRKGLELPYGQNELIEALAAVNKNMVYVNVSGNAVAMPWHAKVPAIVQAWFLGSEAGNALAAVLAGDANPSGKLPFTWVKSLQNVGAHALNTYPGTWRKEGGSKTEGNIIDEEYKEGIYVGYRWADREKQRPVFAFGHGLSYTQFAISNLRADKASMTAADSITFTVQVKNIGQRAGSETVQLYVHDAKASVDRPLKELKGFCKVSLQPGESKDVSITLGKDALSFYDETTASWKAEPGLFEAWVGNASDNLKLRKSFQLK